MHTLNLLMHTVILLLVQIAQLYLYVFYQHYMVKKLGQLLGCAYIKNLFKLIKFSSLRFNEGITYQHWQCNSTLVICLNVMV